ncbi:hypothetical protein DACRYDRAFT_108549 [Dacryopinax primogenitus]|uniref:Uncharacterized protein n=1 Tax=Dacryopinax primogenitus (strain DJM 731) TaxID=1858805 RepID=M5FZD2_DACPD|nr:uncharacterized protein DACRYDRAFT_108549 [Dacryopinax primogenitus]EJU01220.1 hypothetical protein DACRYDRAFT_108549 [Dacryopinax primogenitus]
MDLDRAVEGFKARDGFSPHLAASPTAVSSASDVGHDAIGTSKFNMPKRKAVSPLAEEPQSKRSTAGKSTITSPSSHAAAEPSSETSLAVDISPTLVREHISGDVVGIVGRLDRMFDRANQDWKSFAAEAPKVVAEQLRYSGSWHAFSMEFHEVDEYVETVVIEALSAPALNGDTDHDWDAEDADAMVRMFATAARGAELLDKLRRVCAFHVQFRRNESDLLDTALQYLSYNFFTSTLLYTLPVTL